jgi:hypothetical protein
MGWNDVGMSAGGKDIMKWKPQEKVVLHVISEEPKSFYQFFNQTIQRGVVLPDGFKDPEIKARAQHAFVVWSYRDEAPKIWILGNRVAAQLKGIFDSYDGTLDGIDLTVTRNGDGKETTYILVPKPSKFDQAKLEGVELPDLEVSFAANTEEEIENLKNGIAPGGDEEGGVPPADDGDGAAPAEEPPAEEETTPAEGTAPEDASPAEEPEDEEAQLAAQLAALKAKKAAAAKVAAGKPAPGKPAVGKPAATVGDPRIALVKTITHKFATNAKFKTPAARMAAIKGVAKGKTTLSQLSVQELQALSKKLG